MTDAIAVRDLRKAYPAHVAVDGLTMSVAKGSVFGFLGPNGAGKTTTVRMLLGFARPTSGAIDVLGQTISGASDAELAHLRGRIGFLPDVPGFYPWMRAADVLQFAGSLVGVRGSTLRSRTDDLLGLAGLTDVRQKVGSYSRGMRQRLGIAQALVGAPDLLILDEPTSALDPIGRKDVLDMVSALRGRATVFFSTHILSDVERVCDEVAILDQGRLVTQGTVDELRQRYGGFGAVRARRGRGHPPGRRGVGHGAVGRSGHADGDGSGRGRERPRPSEATGAGADRPARSGPGAVRADRDLARGRLRVPRGACGMTGYLPFLRKELREILATWRIVVIPVTMLFCAVASPLLAKATPYLVSTVANLPITLPDPTVADAYAQWIKNLGQIALLVVIVSFAGAVTTERTSGTAALALSKQLTPAAFVLAKVTAGSALVAASTAVSTLVMWAMTHAVFGEAPGSPLVASTGAWLLLALLCLAIVVLLSTLLDATSASAGLGIGAWVVLAAISAWGPATRWSPAGMVPLPSSLAAGLDVAWVWPVITAAAAAVVLVVAAILTLRRREL